MSSTQKIAEFGAAPHHNEIGAEVAHAVRRAILDSIGVAAAVTRHPASDKVIAMIEGLGATGPCRIIGSSIRTDPVNAGLANGVMAHVFDWDDTILPTRAHLSAVLLPALMAAGEIRGSTFAHHLELVKADMAGISRTPHGAVVAEDIRDLQGRSG